MWLFLFVYFSHAFCFFAAVLFLLRKTSNIYVLFFYPRSHPGVGFRSTLKYFQCSQSVLWVSTFFGQHLFGRSLSSVKSSEEHWGTVFHGLVNAHNCFSVTWVLKDNLKEHKIFDSHVPSLSFLKQLWIYCSVCMLLSGHQMLIHVPCSSLGESPVLLTWRNKGFKNTSNRFIGICSGFDHFRSILSATHGPF